MIVFAEDLSASHNSTLDQSEDLLQTSTSFDDVTVDTSAASANQDRSSTPVYDLSHDFIDGNERFVSCHFVFYKCHSN